MHKDATILSGFHFVHATARGERTGMDSGSVFGTWLGILLAIFLSPHSSAAQTLKPEDIYQKLLPSVMTLHVENSQGESYIGTAFLALDKNTAVTAWHVIS